MREKQIIRTTKETDINLTLNLDGSGTYNGTCGVGFFDHMLSAFCVHAGFDLDLKMKGDLEVDCHHSIEDLGIVLGQAIKEAVGDKKSIKRYGYSILPMDETLMLCSLDLSGRPYFQSDFTFQGERCGYFDTAMTKEFFYAISYSALMNLHFKMLAGENDHHIIECAFKSFAKSLDAATMVDERITSVLSTKGTL